MAGISSATRRLGAAPALGLAGLALAAAVSACSSGFSPVQSPQNQQGSYTAAPSQVHPSAGSVPASPATGSVGPTGETNTGGTGQAPGSAAASAVITSWRKFFSPRTSSSERVALLQNGPQFASALKALAASPLASKITSKVDSVTVSSSSRAEVTYELSVPGSSAMKSASGTAVKQDGTWKVGDDAACRLLAQAKSAGAAISRPQACS